jgi:hypothetical protein
VEARNVSEEWLRLRVREVPLQWHEAVAIVRDVADTLAAGDLCEVPSTDKLAVDAEGFVHLLQPGAPRRAQRPSDAVQVTELSRLLFELLPDGAPQELVRLAANQGADPAPGTAADFSRTLAFFERPSRQQDLQRLAGRLSATQEQRQLEAELESLTRKARADTRAEPHPQAPPPEVPRDVSPPSQRHRHSRVPAVLVVVCCTVVVVMAGAFVGLRLVAPQSASAAQPTARQAQHEDGIFSKVTKAARSFFSAPDATAFVQRDGADRGTPGPEKRKTPRRFSTGRAVASAGVNEPRSVEPVQAPALRRVEWPQVPSWNVAVEEIAVPLERAPLTPEERATVYDTRNDDVVPALLIKPKLASIDQPDALARARSILEAVIAEDGHVVQVRLVRTTPERRYYDAMLLPAVKAWVFEPASRGGQPVRYRLRIPLT